MKYYTYIAKCSDDSLYTGYCKNRKEREETHNSGKGAKYTRGRIPVEIVYYEVFESISEAMKREIQIKKLSRLKKKDLISSAK